MKFCYCDETGTGEEPYAVLLGIVVDASRMHLAKQDWKNFLADLSATVGQELQELHTRNFYAGNGVWKKIDGKKRAQAVTLFMDWFAERKHRIVFSAIDKKKYNYLKQTGKTKPGIDTIWKAMGFHVVLSMQKNYQKETNNKGNTVFIFDEEVKEETKFQKLVLNPPEWCESYYSKKPKQDPLDQIVDAPYFADSKDIYLIQVADFMSYFVRRYIEIKEGDVPEKYKGEEDKVIDWFGKIKARTIPYTSMYPKQKRCEVAEFYWDLAPNCIKNA